MIIDLKTIQHAKRSYEISFGKEWWKQGEQLENEQIIGLDAPLSAKINVYRAGKRVVLEGELHGTMRMICDRCMEEYVQDLNQEFRVFLEVSSSRADTPELELMEDDMDVGFVNNDEIELDDIIREQVFLSLPIKSICNDGCLGLCPVCGGNRNKKQCGCHGKTGHPAFSVLKNLMIKGEQ